MASKTVTRSIDRTIHEFYISFQISQRVLFSASTIHAQWKKLSFPLNSSKDTLIVFLSCMCELITMAGHDICTVHYIKYDKPTSLTATRCPRSPRLRKWVWVSHIWNMYLFSRCFSRTQSVVIKSWFITFVENDEQTHKLVFCHSKEARSFTTRNALSVNMKKERVFRCVLEWPWNKRAML